MEIAERLQMIINSNRLTNAAFADKIGVQRSSVSHVLAGRNKPSIDFIQKIIQHFPKVDAQWLITGKQSTANKASHNLQTESTIRTTQSSDSNQGTREEQSAKVQSGNNRSIKKIVLFFDDGTYQELTV